MVRTGALNKWSNSSLCFLCFHSLSNEDNGPRGRADKLTLQEILHAAGVESLDEPSDALNAKGKPFRRHGIVLRVAINYQNSDSSFLGTGYGFSSILLTCFIS